MALMGKRQVWYFLDPQANRSPGITTESSLLRPRNPKTDLLADLLGQSVLKAVTISIEKTRLDL